jgi:hypothetical protein
MRFRTIIAAAAVPAATAGLLLATAASSAAAAPAVTTAAVSSPSGTVTLVTHERGVDDTTNVPTGETDPTGNGPIWAYDNVERVVTITADKTTAGAYDVTVATYGQYRAFANPITGTPWKGHGSMAGEITYVVTPPAGDAPVHHLPYWTNSSYRSGGVLNEAFGLPRDSSALTHVSGGDDGQYNFVYFGVPGAPGGLYFQH